MRPALRSIQKATARKASEKNTGLQPVSSTQFGMTRSRAAHNMTQNKSLPPEPSASTAGEPISTPASPAEFSIDALSPRQQRAVLVCDVVESVRWMEHDEDNAITRWSQFAAKVRASIAPEHQGRVVKSTGDGLMIEFEQAPQAVAAAHALQKLAQEGNQRHAPQDPERQMHLRIGIHQAQIRSDSHDIYGHGVNLAARISTLAGPGEIIVTPEVRDHLTDSLDGDIEDMGECYLKHLSEPQRVYRVGENQKCIAPVFQTRDQSGISPALAVMSLTSLNPSLNQWAIGDLLADGINVVLSRGKQFKLISRLSLRPFDLDSKRIVNAEKVLGVDYVLTGTYLALDHESTSKLIVTVSLNETKSNEIVWTDQYLGRVADLLQTDNQLAQQIANGLQQAILDRAAQAVMLNPVPNIPSYALHLGAVSMMHRFSRQDFFKAQEILQHLIERTPRWSMPYALLAKWNMLLVEQGWSDDPKKCGDLARDFAHRALDRHQSNALAHTVDGIVHCNLLHDLQGGLKCYEQALQVDPNEPLAWLSKGMAHAFLGDAEQAIVDMKKACALSPLDPQRYYYTSLMASAHLTANDYANAIDWAKESLRHNGSHVSTHRVLTIAQVLSGDVHTARLSAKKLMQLSPKLTVQGYLSRAPSAGFNRAKEFAYALSTAGVPQN
jgi:adenylate cyclase